jgi:hypothetical protein
MPSQPLLSSNLFLFNVLRNRLADGTCLALQRAEAQPGYTARGILQEVPAPPGRGVAERVIEMSERLHELMAAERNVLREALLTQIRHSTSAHYRSMELEALRERCGTLVSKFLEAVQGSPRCFVDYIAGIAGTRFGEGFRLEEIQMALNIFEEYAWKICAHKVEDKEQLLKDLSLVTGIFGTAKDQLALAYLKQRNGLLSSARPLIEKLEELSSVTESSELEME